MRNLLFLEIPVFPNRILQFFAQNTKHFAWKLDSHWEIWYFTFLWLSSTIFLCRLISRNYLINAYTHILESFESSTALSSPYLHFQKFLIGFILWYLGVSTLCFLHQSIRNCFGDFPVHCCLVYSNCLMSNLLKSIFCSVKNQN